MPAWWSWACLGLAGESVCLSYSDPNQGHDVAFVCVALVLLALALVMRLLGRDS